MHELAPERRADADSLERARAAAARARAAFAEARAAAQNRSRARRKRARAARRRSRPSARRGTRGASGRKAQHRRDRRAARERGGGARRRSPTRRSSSPPPPRARRRIRRRGSRAQGGRRRAGARRDCARRRRSRRARRAGGHGRGARVARRLGGEASRRPAPGAPSSCRRLRADLDVEPAGLAALAGAEARRSRCRRCADVERKLESCARSASGSARSICAPTRNSPRSRASRDKLIAERDDLTEAIKRLRGAIGTLNQEGRERLVAAFDVVNSHFGEPVRDPVRGRRRPSCSWSRCDDPLRGGPRAARAARPARSRRR